MTKTKKIVLWVIALLQFNATAYFVLHFALDGRGAAVFGIPVENFAAHRGVQVLGLVLGVVLGWMALRMSLQRANRAETALRHCSVQFADLLEEHFSSWHLTPAERDVALFLIKGLSTRAISEVRGTSEGTIKAQTNAIYRKAGVGGRTQLLSLFIEDLMDDTLLPEARPQISVAA